MEREVAWKKYDEEQLAEMGALAADYIDFISDNKTERECAAASIELAEKAGYRSLDEAVRQGRALVPGDKVWACDHGKAVILVQLGRAPLAEGANILGAHIDSPRLDLKQNPLYESNGFAFLDTHYYGGIKHYQWVTLPLALHGVIAKKDGTVVEVRLGEDPGDPVFCVTDLLPHLGNQQMGKKASEVVEGEALDVLVGNRPASNRPARSCADAPAGDSAARRSAAQDPADPSCASLLQSDDDIDGVQTVAPSSHADADARTRYRIEIVKNTATPESTAQDTSVLLLDAAPVFKALLDDLAAGVPVGVIARRFHDAFVQAIADVAELCRALYGIGTVALSGGVFMNRYLIENALETLERAGFAVAVNRELPPNDGCVSYGQAVVAWAANDEKA